MNRLLIAVALLGVLAVAGCIVPSLKPLYTPDTIIADAALVNHWVNADASESYTFSAGEDGAYTLAVIDSDGGETTFTAHLVQAGEYRFLDIMPSDIESSCAGYMPWHFVPTHSFYLVEQITPKLKLRTMNPEWLMRYLAENPGAIAASSIEMNGDILPVLTAGPEKLQEFLAAHVTTLDAFYGDVELSPAAAESPLAASDERARNVARTLCSAQAAYYVSHGNYAQSLAELAAPPPFIDPTWAAGDAGDRITMEFTQAGTDSYDVVVHSPTGRNFHLDETGLISELEASTVSAGRQL